MIETAFGLAAYLEQGGLDGDWHAALGIGIRAAVASSPLPVDVLTPGELERYRRLQDPVRRRTWLTGRAALKRLLRRLDRASDTSLVDFPAADISLSHSGGIALAVACAETFSEPASASARGLGVDIEADRSLRPEAARFFLTPDEQERLARPGPGAAGMDHAQELLRAWTIKEAVFKSDPDNRGRMLADYRLADAAARVGTARLAKASEVTGGFRYISHHLAGWRISVAAYFRESEGMHGQG